MAIVTCQECGERVFTITGWADVGHCPRCYAPFESEAGSGRPDESVANARPARRFRRRIGDRPLPETPAGGSKRETDPKGS